jgi:hypothetical protein
LRLNVVTPNPVMSNLFTTNVGACKSSVADNLVALIIPVLPETVIAEPTLTISFDPSKVIVPCPTDNIPVTLAFPTKRESPTTCNGFCAFVVPIPIASLLVIVCAAPTPTK